MTHVTTSNWHAWRLHRICIYLHSHSRLILWVHRSIRIVDGHEQNLTEFHYQISPPPHVSQPCNSPWLCRAAPSNFPSFTSSCRCSACSCRRFLHGVPTDSTSTWTAMIPHIVSWNWKAPFQQRQILAISPHFQHLFPGFFKPGTLVLPTLKRWHSSSPGFKTSVEVFLELAMPKLIQPIGQRCSMYIYRAYAPCIHVAYWVHMHIYIYI